MKNIFYFIFLFAFIIFSCKNESNKEEADKQRKELLYEERELHEMREMAEKSKQPAPDKENPYKDAQIDVVVYNNDTVKQDVKYTGYGYKILIYGSPQVNQPHRPGMPGLDGFKTAEAAKKVGEFVAYKIRNNIMPPSVTMQEMDSLGVLNK